MKGNDKKNSLAIRPSSVRMTMYNFIICIIMNDGKNCVSKIQFQRLNDVFFWDDDVINCTNPGVNI